MKIKKEKRDTKKIKINSNNKDIFYLCLQNRIIYFVFHFKKIKFFVIKNESPIE